MAKSKNRGHRETRKVREPIPEVPDLGRLSMPRKTNRAAAKYVATVGRLWDRRRAARKALKKGLARQESDALWREERLRARIVRDRMLETMTGWVFDHRLHAFVAQGGPPPSVEAVEQLIRAVIANRHETLAIRVADLSPDEAAEVRKHLSRDWHLVVVKAS